MTASSERTEAGKQGVSHHGGRRVSIVYQHCLHALRAGHCHLNCHLNDGGQAPFAHHWGSQPDHVGALLLGQEICAAGSVGLGKGNMLTVHVPSTIYLVLRTGTQPLTVEVEDTGMKADLLKPASMA